MGCSSVGITLVRERPVLPDRMLETSTRFGWTTSQSSPIGCAPDRIEEVLRRKREEMAVVDLARDLVERKEGDRLGPEVVARAATREGVGGTLTEEGVRSVTAATRSALCASATSSHSPLPFNIGTSSFPSPSISPVPLAPGPTFAYRSNSCVLSILYSSSSSNPSEFATASSCNLVARY